MCDVPLFTESGESMARVMRAIIRNDGIRDTMSCTVGFKFGDDRLGSRVCKVIDFPKVTVVVDSHEIVLAVVGE